MAQLDDIRRHPDGSIDHSYYRLKAEALRRAAMQGELRRLAGLRRYLARAWTLLAALFTRAGVSRS